ncbi:hypothetical protein VTJ83DRAFT_6219 [Remersonia thermophila]|uniref:DOC domain-containing protein n=1 Tax=Remersonia thermophila TaxID=72144 RepID=A0ABR4D420_9PEZI
MPRLAGPNDHGSQRGEARRYADDSYGGDESDEELMEAVGDDDDELLDDPMTEDLAGEVSEVEDDHLGSEDEDEDEEQAFNPAALGLKEINNLAHFSVSSYRPGNGVPELLSDDLDKYWQSDGQQPHILTIHFLRRVEIRAIRFYVDYAQDESYTPTHVVFYAGTGHHDLIQFAELPLANPVGWQDVPIEGSGGGADGNSLCCWIVQMHIKENHQNGKDTHIRGVKIYALDDQSLAGVAREFEPGSTDEVNEEHGRPLPTRRTQSDSIRELLDAFERHPISASSTGDGPREPVIR